MKYNITRAVKLASVKDDPFHCVSSTAIRVKHPHLKTVETTKNWIKVTKKDGVKLRAKTPPEVCSMLLKFDKSGRPPALNSFELVWELVPPRVPVSAQEQSEETLARMAKMREAKAEKARTRGATTRFIKKRVDGLTRLVPLEA